MKSILYITNIPAPYRIEFFNRLAEKSNVTVVYERLSMGDRDLNWLNSVEIKHNQVVMSENEGYSHFKTGLKIAKYILSNYKKYDEIILGCCNSKAQMLAYLILCFLRKDFAVNLDGETFFDDKGLKLFAKRFFVKGAKRFYIAGIKSAKNAKKVIQKAKAKYIPYYFSSLTKNEIAENEKKSTEANREDYVLVVGRFFDYKGLDIALQVAKEMPETNFKFVGMAERTESFEKLVLSEKVTNAEVVSFMTKEELEQEYLKCKVLLLPSRKECWGLVVNEAASYGTPIVSTYGSGAAVEFFSEKYPELLAEPENVSSLKKALESFLNKDEKYLSDYKKFVLEIGRKYTIEKNVEVHLKALENRESNS